MNAIQPFSSMAFNKGANSPWLNPAGQQSYGARTVRFTGCLAYGAVCVTAASVVGVFYHVGKASVEYWNSFNDDDSMRCRERSWEHLKCAFEDGMVTLDNTIVLIVLGILIVRVPLQLKTVPLSRLFGFTLISSIFVLACFNMSRTREFARNPNSFKINDHRPIAQKPFVPFSGESHHI